jgi:hypothetical protein
MAREIESGRVRIRLLRLGRDDVWSVPGKLCDDGRIEVQGLGNHIDWTVRQPIG